MTSHPTNNAIHRRPSIAILTSAAIRSNDSVRHQVPTPVNRLQRLLFRRLFPGLQPAVRGNVVAADSLIAFMARHLKKYDLTILSHPSALPQWKDHITELASHSSVAARVVPLTDILDEGLDKFFIQAWVDPLLAPAWFSEDTTVDLSQSVRNLFSSHLYPITMVSHGLSYHRLLYETLLRVCIAGTYPCDSIICSSRASCKAARALIEHVTSEMLPVLPGAPAYRGRFDIIPLAVDTELFTPRPKQEVRRALRLPLDATVLLVLGRLSFLKADLLPLVTVMSMIMSRRQGRNLLLLIAGTDDRKYTELLKEHARELGIEPHLKIMLNISDKEKQILYPAADIFLSPADGMAESFGLTPLEAMACGVPQIVSDWSGYRDIVVHGETGFLVPTYWNPDHSYLKRTGTLLGWMYDHLAAAQSVVVDVAQLTQYLETLIDNTELRASMAAASRARAIREFAPEKIVANYEELWCELSNIAAAIQDYERVGWYESPDYDTCFGHYASRNLDGREIVFPDERKRKILASAAYQRYLRELSSLKLIDPAVNDRLLQCLSAELAIGPRDVSIDELLTILSENDCIPSSIALRHVTFLLKHGLLKLGKQPPG
jgi:D-inositol-3-phosphate glycosyltransferase